MLVDAHAREGLLRQIGVDACGARDLGQVARAAQEAVGDAWGPATAARDEVGSGGGEVNPEQARRACEHPLQLLGRVGRQALEEPEAAAEGRRQEAVAGRRAHQGEALEGHVHHARVRTLVEGQVDVEVLHGRVEVLLHGRRNAVDLVDEEHVAALQLSQDPHQIPRPVEGRARGGVQGAAEFAGQDARQAGLPQTGRAREQYVIEDVAARARGLDSHLQVAQSLLLTHELGEARGP